MKGYLAGFDIGGTKLALAVADRAGEIVVRLREEVDVEAERFADYRDGVAYLGLGEQMVRLLRQALEETGIERVAAIGIGAAGPLKEGAIKDSTHIKPRKIPSEKVGLPVYIPLIEPLRKEFPVPIRVENDCTVAVLGEVHYGVGKEIEDKDKLHLVYLTISTGIGAGVWDGGQILRGKDGNAAEVGHFFVKKDGLKCDCGNYGCAEAYCSGTGIAKNARMRLINEDLRPEGDYGSIILQLAQQAEGSRPQVPGSRWDLLERITAPLVFRAAEEGDRLAQEVIDEACFYGGVALANVANAYDPEIITVGGALALEHPEILKPMREEMLKHLNVEPPEVRLTLLGEEAVLRGALALAGRVLAPSGVDPHRIDYDK
jgi:glucokinase